MKSVDWKCSWSRVLKRPLAWLTFTETIDVFYAALVLDIKFWSFFICLWKFSLYLKFFA